MDLIHVGMPKAASTWLQEEFFPAHPELAVLGARQGDDDLYAAFLDQVRTLVHGGDLAAGARQATREMGRLAGELGRRRGARLLGISHEALCGEWPAGRNAAFVARVLAEAFPAARVVLVVREPRALLLSSYRQFVRMGGTATLPRFLWDPRQGAGTVANGAPLQSQVIEFCCHAERVRLYRELFPAGVHIDCLERLQRDPSGFAADLCAFLGVAPVPPPARRANVQLSDAALRLLRPLNHLGCTRLHPRHGPLPLAALLAWRRRRRLPEDHPLRANPYLLRAACAEQLHRRFVEGPLAWLDRLLLRRLPARRFSLDSLRAGQRAFLEERFCADGRALRELLPWDPAAFGYSCGGSGALREPQGGAVPGASSGTSASPAQHCGL